MNDIADMSISQLTQAFNVIDPKFGDDWRIRLETLHAAVLAYQKTQQKTSHAFLEANGRGDRFSGFYRCEQKDHSSSASTEEAKRNRKTVLFTKNGFAESVLKALLRYVNIYGNEVQTSASTYCKVVWAFTHMSFMFNRFNRAKEFSAFLSRALAKQPSDEPYIFQCKNNFHRNVYSCFAFSVVFNLICVSLIFWSEGKSQN